MNIGKRAGATLLAMLILFAATLACAAQPKYVFFFLGDGMSASQIQATEAYLATKYAVDRGQPLGPNSGELDADYLLADENRLNMSKMPVAGMQTTYDSFALMTDSASSATAFACGIKTRSGVIGMDDTKTHSYKSIAQLAHESGMKVGIISSVSLDHATPAAYYASVPSRGDMNNIGTQLAATGYEFFGGGGLVKPDAPNDVWGLLTNNGYEVRNTRESILALKDAPRDRVVCINPWLQDASAMPYAIDRPETNLSLAEMTEVAIANLYGGASDHPARPNSRKGRGKKVEGKGFFIMVEGGKIDWACHANDAMATIGDMLDFDDAVGVALDFYRKHPAQTLIVVTGDHETGGMTVGHATTAYKAYYDRLLNQTSSFQYFKDEPWTDHKGTYSACCPDCASNPDTLSSNSAMLDLMKDFFGLDWADLNAYQKEKLEDAYDQSLCGTNDNSADENRYLYGGYEPIIVTITHILNERASIGWTSYSHTGVPVPIFAQGREAERFAGFYDNTDIAKQLAEAMNLPSLPTEK
ncbi:alkaline phosphatase [Desulfatiglans anilini]|uniref:alkaline phosphatase n=1 Tax=Desulfatiglans anilini TaxID=90728 RepID=UPI00041F8BFE|nr:alkaline phosphatase [Desulfatiglans anilini]